jgi:DNA-binding SARP family transcriptional activator
MQVRVLGPLEVTRGGTQLTLGGTKQRAVFAMLALRINRVVSMDFLVDGLWESAPPADPTNVVQVYLSRLRKAMRPAGTQDTDDGTLIRRKPGYLLQLDPEHLDLHRFQRLSQEGSKSLTTAPGIAAATLTDALALWRGVPLAEFTEEPFARNEISRLQELHLSALSARIQADLAVGRHAELIAELEELMGRYPLHEGIRAQLMLSLYRSGRQAEALDTFRRAREVFAEELGIDPGRDLQDLETAVLAHDPLLDWTAAPATSVPQVASGGGDHSPRGPEPHTNATSRPVRVSNVPTRNPHFTGRAALLDQLHDQLCGDRDTLTVQALYGLGGVGKSQLTIEYAHRFAADYDLVWWIDAERPVLIPDQLLGLADMLGLPTVAVPAGVVVKRVLTELGSVGRWLLIFDNAERPADIADYRPSGGGHVLVTSRSPGWGALGGRVEVDVLDRSETVALLRARLPEMTVEMADKLAAELGDLPLAAAQAAGYLEQTGLPSSDYLRRLRSHRAGLLADGDVLDYQGRVDTTWEISLERLRAVSPAAVGLLEISAFLAPEPIPLSMFTEHADLLDEPLRSVAKDPDTLADSVGAMVGFSLARRSRDGYQLHRLLQKVIRNRIPPSQHQAARAQAVALLAASAPRDATDPTHWRAYARLAPHIIAAGHEGDDDPALRQLMFALNVAQGLRGGDIEAQRQATQDLYDRWHRTLGADHPDTLRIASSLIFALGATGEHDKACTLGLDTLQRMRSVRGPDHLETLYVASTVAFALVGMGEPFQACTVGQDTLQRMRRVRGADHVETLVVASTVARALAGMGDVEQAGRLGDDTLRRLRQNFGADAPATLRISSGIAIALAIAGDKERARMLAQDTLQRATQTLGPDHPLTLNLSMELALTLVWTTEGQGLEPSDDPLPRTLRTLGPGHRSARRAALYLEFVRTSSTLPEQVVDMAEDTWQRALLAYGPENPATQYLQAILALALARSGDPERAKTLASAVQRDSRARFGLDLVTLVATAALTLSLTALGQTEQALAIGVAMVQPALDDLGEDHPLSPTYQRELSGIGQSRQA